MVFAANPLRGVHHYGMPVDGGIEFHLAHPLGLYFMCHNRGAESVT